MKRSELEARYVRQVNSSDILHKDLSTSEVLEMFQFRQGWVQNLPFTNYVSRIGEHGGFVAGGGLVSMLRGEEPRDLDVFFDSAQKSAEAREFPARTRFSAEVDKHIDFVYGDEDDPAIDGYPVRRYFEVDNTLATFDLTAVQVALQWDPERKVFVLSYGPYFYEALYTGNIYFTGIELVSPFKAAGRLAKYQAKGFNVEQGMYDLAGLMLIDAPEYQSMVKALY